MNDWEFSEKLGIETSTLRNQIDKLKEENEKLLKMNLDLTNAYINLVCKLGDYNNEEVVKKYNEVVNSETI